MDDVGDDAPDLEFLSVAKLDRWEVGILGEQLNPASPTVEPFDSEVAIDDGNHNGPVGWIQRAIDDQEIAFMNAGIDHGVAGHPQEVRGFGMTDQVFIEIEAFGNVVVGGTGKSSPDW